MLKKEEVYLNITTKRQAKELLVVLQEAKEPIYKNSRILSLDFTGICEMYMKEWMSGSAGHKTLITIDQLREMLNVKRELKVGDKVRVVSIPDGFITDRLIKRIGKVGVVTDVFYGSVLILDDNKWEVNFMPKNLELITEANPVKTQTVTRKALAEIYPNVCEEWQKRIDAVLLTNKFGDDFEVSLELASLAYNDIDSDIQRGWLNKHLPKPKKMVTKEVVQYGNMDALGNVTVYSTEETALYYAGFTKLPKAIKLTGTYQIEE